MNGPTHQLAGIITTLIATKLDAPEKHGALHHPAAAIPLGAFFGKLPDIIEPALRNPHHRQFFHSVTVFGLLISGMHKAYHWEPNDDFERIVRGIVLLGGISYLSHLVLDASTSRSLPLVGKL